MRTPAADRSRESAKEVLFQGVIKSLVLVRRRLGPFTNRFAFGGLENDRGRRGRLNFPEESAVAFVVAEFHLKGFSFGNFQEDSCPEEFSAVKARAIPVINVSAN
ncbi:MAG: hypothetical protein CMJ81_13560 [Planctomycetaceae bacterium]|nr:hypothetical protein [Planctomycetaceae bacterium]MBP62547.1 hypothetical protein [Planctomycetaceae bacterium]